jgi:hypothetical protein
VGEPRTSEYDCYVETQCDNDFIYTSCFAETGDQWYCDCMSNYRYLSLEVSGSDPATMCASVAELCASPDTIASAEPEECTVQYQTQGVDYCDYGVVCTQTVEAGDITAELQSWKDANCYSDENGQLRCNCSNESVYRTYLIEGVGTDRSCQLVMDLCESDEELVFEDPPVCETVYQDSFGEEYCSTEWECLQQTPVQEGVTALLSEWQYASCYPLNDTTVSCDCNGSQSYMRFSTAGTVDASMCSTAQQVCIAEEEIALSGPITCEPRNQSRGDGSCYASMECSQEGLFNRQALIVYGEVSIDCSLDASGAPWSCTCRSGTEATSLELEAADEWEACTLASGRCPDAVEVQIGSSNYGYYPMVW